MDGCMYHEWMDFWMDGRVVEYFPSIFQSQYSSQEQLAGAIEELRISTRFDSNDSYAGALPEGPPSAGAPQGSAGGIRPRSRSFK